MGEGRGDGHDAAIHSYACRRLIMRLEIWLKLDVTRSDWAD